MAGGIEDNCLNCRLGARHHQLARLLLLQHQKTSQTYHYGDGQKNEANMPHHSNQIMYKLRRLNFFGYWMSFWSRETSYLCVSAFYLLYPPLRTSRNTKSKDRVTLYRCVVIFLHVKQNGSINGAPSWWLHHSLHLDSNKCKWSLELVCFDQKICAARRFQVKGLSL